MPQIILFSTYWSHRPDETPMNKNSVSYSDYWPINNVVGPRNRASINRMMVSLWKDSIFTGWLFVLCGFSLLLITLVFAVSHALPSRANPNHIIPLLVSCVILVIPILVLGVCHIKGI